MEGAKDSDGIRRRRAARVCLDAVGAIEADLLNKVFISLGMIIP